MTSAEDLTNKKFGKLTVIERAENYYTPDGLTTSAKWKCKCDCGNIIYPLARNLKTGTTTSCGCNRKERQKTNDKVSNL